MKRKLLAAFVLAAGMAFGAIGIGISIGPPPPPRVLAVPVSPGPGYAWVGGYWYPVGGRYVWHDGYWTRPPYVGATWIGPRHDGRFFYEGYWEGSHGRIEHHHDWDRRRDRDWDREHDRR
jgi:hypothetical protein